MKKRIKMWVKLNKPYVIWVSIILIYTFIMLGIIVFITATDEEGKSSFTSRVNQLKETEVVTEEQTTEEVDTEEMDTEIKADSE